MACMLYCALEWHTPWFASWQPMLEIWKAMTISLWSHLLMTSSVWSACVWPETHNRSTAVERCSVKYVWRNIRSIPATVLSAENSLWVLRIKEVRLFYQNCTCIVHEFHNTGERDILSLKTRCDNTSNGCKWVRELRLLDEHLAGCSFTLLPCPNACKCHNGDNKCNVVKLLRKNLEKHTKEECPRRQYQCPHCQEAGEYWERRTKHLNECPMKEILCPNLGCRTRIAQQDLFKHCKECLFEIVPCKYAIIGCKMEVLRKDLAEHEGDSQHHLQLAIDMVCQQQTTIKEQENMLARLHSRTGMPMKYKFTEYDHHKAINDVIYIPGCYTSQGGYKICISVHANGCGKSKGTHVSVYAHLMKGENDDLLRWPFTGKVIIELLNQLKDKNHYSKTITFSRDDEVSQRVVKEERASAGWGCSSYISHSDLGYNAEKNCQYLKDDRLHFRISADAKKSSTPWLI